MIIKHDTSTRRQAKTIFNMLQITTVKPFDWSFSPVRFLNVPHELNLTKRHTHIQSLYPNHSAFIISKAESVE